MKIVIPMAGPEPQFSKIGQIKALVEIADKPMIELVVDNLKSIRDDAEFIFVIRKEICRKYHLDDVLKLLVPNATIVTAQNDTAGAACTAMLAIDHLQDNDPMIITNGDQLIQTDLNKAMTDLTLRNLDAGTIVFESIHPRWSYVLVDENQLVVEAAEKWPISKMATAGFYYFKQAGDFIEAVGNMLQKQASVNDWYYVCPTFNELILKQKRIGIHQIKRTEYISLATPEGVEAYSQSLRGNHRTGKDE
ncbi:MAG: nucleotidyltransferase [Phycisphaeraceae bacterium]|nr:nucleotidyltransferase [Phycisphaeraceae bacterium]